MLDSKGHVHDHFDRRRSSCRLRSQNLSATAFGAVQYLNGYSGTLTNGTYGTIKLTDVGVTSIWNKPSSGDWTTAGDWIPPGVPSGSAALAKVTNGGTANVTTAG
ncbi:MAG: hypothetical protein K8T25_00610 [Planctomycetia bacterium]|nr:hypothetical protein [Planctomycetia bacterium]